MKTQVPVRFLFALAMVAASSLVGVAAQTVTAANASSSPLYFPNMDKNHDGLLSRSEVPKEAHELRVHFDQYDLNKDHRISVAEYSAYLKSVAASSGACNSTQKGLADPNCDRNTQLRDATLGASPQPVLPAPSGK